MNPPRWLSLWGVILILGALIYNQVSARSRELTRASEIDAERRQAGLQRAVEAMAGDLDADSMRRLFVLQQAAQFVGRGINPRPLWGRELPEGLVLDVFARRGGAGPGAAWYHLPRAGAPIRLPHPPAEAVAPGGMLLPLPLDRTRLALQVEAVDRSRVAPPPGGAGTIRTPDSARIRFLLILDGPTFQERILWGPSSRLFPDYFTAATRLRIRKRDGSNYFLISDGSFNLVTYLQPPDARAPLLTPRGLDDAAARLQLQPEWRWAPRPGFTGPAPETGTLELWAHDGALVQRADGLEYVQRFWLTLEAIALAYCFFLLVALAVRTRRLAAAQAEFIASMTHELRTPLTVIRAGAENLEDGLVSDPVQVRTYGATLARGARRLEELVERVLLLSRLRRGRLERRPVDLLALVERAVAEQRDELEAAGMEVALKVDPGLPPAYGDQEALEAALRNLISNALKHGGRGGRLAIEVGPHPRRRNRARLTVRDWGAGILAAEHRRLARPFFRGRAAEQGQVPGSGLGLAVVDRIARALGGRLSWSDAAPGAAFHLDLVSPGAVP